MSALYEQNLPSSEPRTESSHLIVSTSMNRRIRGAVIGKTCQTQWAQMIIPKVLFPVID